MCVCVCARARVRVVLCVLCARVLCACVRARARDAIIVRMRAPFGVVREKATGGARGADVT